MKYLLPGLGALAIAIGVGGYFYTTKGKKVDGAGFSQASGEVFEKEDVIIDEPIKEVPECEPKVVTKVVYKDRVVNKEVPKYIIQEKLVYKEVPQIIEKPQVVEKYVDYEPGCYANWEKQKVLYVGVRSVHARCVVDWVKRDIRFVSEEDHSPGLTIGNNIQQSYTF